jgi:hypothetical protein
MQDQTSPRATSNITAEQQLKDVSLRVEDLAESFGLHTGPDLTSIDDPHPTLRAQLVYTKAGIPDDGDYIQPPTDGTIVLDTANHRIYIRSGSTWRYAALI